MSHKQLAAIAICMVVIFGGIVMVYPLMFNSNAAPAARVDVAPPSVNH